jgi:glutamyl-Q tRNA(Asp) synthetase
VAALASYVDARAHGGVWLVRIEDIDSQRCHRDHEETILRQLSEYGFVQDGDIVRQSDRSLHYQRVLEMLANKAFTYRCRCTRKQLADAPRNADGETIYPGTCRDIQLEASNELATSVRLNLHVVNDATNIVFSDRAFGVITQNVRDQVGDFILHRADGDFAYQLAVVVDDALQGVTHVVRGADLLSNTARQIVLQRVLGLTTPGYLHVPIATNEHGEKLSKQTRAPSLPSDPKQRLQALRDAWKCLRQQDMTYCASISDFFEQAVALWRPQRLARLETAEKSANL